SVLLDAHYRHPSRCGAVPLVAGGQQHAVLDPESHARAFQRPVREDDVPLLALENVLHRGGVDLYLAVLRAPVGLRPGAAEVPMAGTLGTSIFVTYLVPPTLLFIPLADIIRNFQLGNTPWALILTYPTFLIPFCTWLLMGYFKTIPKELEECA